MPKPYAVIMEEINDRLKGKMGEERVKEIRRLLKEIQWDVGDYRKIKDKLRRELRELETVEQAKKSARKSGQLKKETPQFLVIGATNSGKSTFINNLTNAHIPVADYPFTTTDVQVGAFEYEGVNFQLVELPALYEDCWEHNRSTLAYVYSTDCLLILGRSKEEFELALKALDKQNINLITERMEEGFIQTSPPKIPAILLFDKELKELPSSNLKKVVRDNLEEIKKMMFETIKPIRIYTMNSFNEIKDQPIVFFKDDVTVKDVIQKVRKGQENIFKDAVVLEGGPTGRRKRVGIEYKLSDKDVIHLTFQK